jgi:hypothetical protein
MAGERSVARYGRAGEEPLLTLTCDPQARVILLRRAVSLTGPTPLVITSTMTRRTLTASADTSGDFDGIAGAAAGVSFAPGDRLLDAIAFSRGRFMVEIPDFPALYLPSWPELTRVIEDCRGGVVHRPEQGPKPQS